MMGWLLVHDTLLSSIKIWYAIGVPSKKKKMGLFLFTSFIPFLSLILFEPLETSLDLKQR
jgi:hypothetical protein